jgi:hypothetical protein
MVSAMAPWKVDISIIRLSKIPAAILANIDKLDASVIILPFP